MRLCLTCRHMAPAGAPFCGHCGRSFGGRLCSQWHLSPPSARYCVHCRRTALSDPTSFIPLGWVGPGITVLMFIIAATGIWRVAGRPVEAMAVHLLRIGIVLFIFSLFLPPPVRSGLHRTAVASIGFLGKMAGRLIVFAARWMIAQIKAKP
ncbi:hypothetical protein CCAX7_62220 [Capsulimonas corticalis]|uniref:Uncharacterized protein n=1 Tax=Capsulimonas corticalis TaxID=2219043 RepID=A0A402CWH8_9BACT|nr:zinc ribbon domain-containing protein [Capsulimonas corticalis]BDI34171.1 hypothetical protein CCAX7_62220 [Capsulimonas corticalis]